MLTNQGYVIREAVIFDNGQGFALGENPKAPDPYVTWQLKKDGDRLDFFWGRYHKDPESAGQNFRQRVEDYQNQYHVNIVEQVPRQSLYRYYSTQRPVDIGTYPKSPINPPTKVENYDGRLRVEGGAFLAWGEIHYTRPLSEGELRSYELTPSRFNPDVWRRMSEQAQVVGRWEEQNHIPEAKRLTWYYSDFGSYVPGDFVTPEQLADFARGVERQEAAKARKEAKGKPAPISQQMKDAQAQAEADRGPAAPKKDASDRGDR